MDGLGVRQLSAVPQAQVKVMDSHGAGHSRLPLCHSSPLLQGYAVQPCRLLPEHREWEVRGPEGVLKRS